MKPNIGTLDKAARIIAALAIVSLYFADQITGTAAVILLIFAGVFVLTSFIGVCPLYLPFGISTKKKAE